MSLVMKAQQDEETTDWRLAYLEMDSITEQAKRDIRVPTALKLKGMLLEMSYIIV